MCVVSIKFQAKDKPSRWLAYTCLKIHAEDYPPFTDAQVRVNRSGDEIIVVTVDFDDTITESSDSVAVVHTWRHAFALQQPSILESCGLRVVDGPFVEPVEEDGTDMNEIFYLVTSLHTSSIKVGEMLGTFIKKGPVTEPFIYYRYDVIRDDIVRLRVQSKAGVPIIEMRTETMLGAFKRANRACEDLHWVRENVRANLPDTKEKDQRLAHVDATITSELPVHEPISKHTSDFIQKVRAECDHDFSRNGLGVRGGNTVELFVCNSCGELRYLDIKRM